MGIYETALSASKVVTAKPQLVVFLKGLAANAMRAGQDQAAQELEHAAGVIERAETVEAGLGLLKG